METFTVTADVQSLLRRLKEKTELRASNGNTIGIFTPAEVADAELYEKANKMVDPALIELRKKEKGALPFEEVKKRLVDL